MGGMIGLMKPGYGPERKKPLPNGRLCAFVRRDLVTVRMEPANRRRARVGPTRRVIAVEIGP
ncbi:hypothetical protein DFR52_10710 [Hoeflea marina]|uniref:Uncharacterized protein n=1 Tax=Hoeflea marina TaxID=274592 RepID=A0A317PI82_9HYPH|nr:hypothetical protein DFR52_10710 [Hoeflea marina]